MNALLCFFSVCMHDHVLHQSGFTAKQLLQWLHWYGFFPVCSLFYTKSQSDSNEQKTIHNSCIEITCILCIFFYVLPENICHSGCINMASPQGVFSVELEFGRVSLLLPTSPYCVVPSVMPHHIYEYKNIHNHNGCTDVTVNWCDYGCVL